MRRTPTIGDDNHVLHSIETEVALHVRPTGFTLPEPLSGMTSRAPGWLKTTVKDMSNVHRPNGEPDVFVFSLPRSGSTWVMEMIWSQPGFKCCDEPTDLRNPIVRKHLGLRTWQEMYSSDATATLDSYIRQFRDGTLGFMNPSPLRSSYRPRTNRIVFKIIHGHEDRTAWFQDTFNSRVVFLIRHPIPVSLSRDEYPTLGLLLSGAYRRHFTQQQLSFAERVFADGTKLERGVLSWCMQNAVPLKSASDDWAILSYEQLVTDPIPVVDYLCDKLTLPDPNQMMRQLNVPSHSTHKSDAATKTALTDDAPNQRAWLAEKWRSQVSEAEERRAMEILERFDLDVYRFGDILPNERFWISPRQRLSQR